MKRQPKWKQLTWTSRLKIEALYNAGHTQRFIAHQLGCSAATICRELRRGFYDHLDGATWLYKKCYSAEIAQQDADWKSTAKGGPIKLGSNHSYANHVAEQIHRGRSPDQIVGCLRRQGEWTVSTPTLYRYIDQGYIPGVTNKNLRYVDKFRRKYHSVKKGAKAPKGKSIESRPRNINTRTALGHWEMDCVIGKAKGKDQTLLVLTERVTRFEIIRKLYDKTTASVTQALKSIVAKFPEGTFQTLTVDNGPEFQDYQTMKRYVPEVYYCHPYTSCERGSNENCNRLIRRYFPKGQSFHKITQAHCTKVQNAINDMPRRILGYATAKTC